MADVAVSQAGQEAPAVDGGFADGEHEFGGRFGEVSGQQSLAASQVSGPEAKIAVGDDRVVAGGQQRHVQRRIECVAVAVAGVDDVVGDGAHVGAAPGQIVRRHHEHDAALGCELLPEFFHGSLQVDSSDQRRVNVLLQELSALQKEKKKITFVPSDGHILTRVSLTISSSAIIFTKSI